jgi:DNA-binding response OmpR family regulator
MSFNKCHILCIDDNEDTRFMLTCLLQPHGHEVMTAGSIEEALQLTSSSHFDLYILDNRLSDGSGIDFCQQLRALAPETPIIIYSGSAYEIDRRRGLRAGATAYVAKPEIDGLTNTVNGLLMDKQCMAVGTM